MDKGRCEAWRDEVDKLLIFAGLFSAVVTGFTIEAYKMLHADPSTATVQLVAIVAQQMSNGTSTDATQQAISSVISGMQNFRPEPYAIRVNILWFLSLSLALATAIIGILCMQWLREYQRDSGLSPMELFAVAQMRREGLERWSVPTILSALPLLLQSALVLFFIGLVDFLRNFNTTVAAAITAFVVVTLFFLATTTILPAFQFLLHGNYHFRVPQCPFKSPQSWAFCRLAFSACSIISYFAPDAHFVVSMPDRIPWRYTFERGRLALHFWHWQNFDKYWYDKRMRYQALTRSRELDDDLANGLVRLASTHFPKVPVFYHVLQCMRSSPLEVNKVGNLLFRLLGSKHNRICGALQRLSVVQAKDALGLLSLRYLPEPSMQCSPAAIKSYLEFAIRINNTVEDEDAMIDFMPPIHPDELRRIDVPDDIIYHGFKCIGRLARADRDLRYGVDNLFMLLVSTMAEQSVRHQDTIQVNRLLESMFNACQRIERWSQQRRVGDMRAALKCASWVASAFASPMVDQRVSDKWKQHSAFEKLLSLLRTLDGLSKEIDEVTFPNMLAPDGPTWTSIRRTFFSGEELNHNCNFVHNQNK
ncbi:hypothetical protein M378DRAFT_1005918 [Amanita muscaria Koide BX008]|uniref:DUF6535 domain-containing protein n=1 Tax=Amanita muscaria (strain Koide BX008) TaxID=946122 RepID=A0A0C2S9I6_AMAMK|nr:hypothetical protein M378DRAFT_1005918 [Amanita muscaria Koide BX008]